MARNVRWAACVVALAVVVAPAAGAQSAPRHTAADVRFMQGMIAHHAQAVAMAALVATRSANAALHSLAERIDVSQKDEIALMRGWLTDRHEAAPDPTAPHEMMGHDMPGATMPGMLTPQQMTALANANGTAFDRLFLAGMIQHHEGALVMVKALFASPGAGQDGAIFRFASDVETDQRAEIARMKAMLAALQN